MMTRPTSTPSAFALLALCVAAPVRIGSQMSGMESHAHAKTVPSTTLTLTGPTGKTLTLSPGELKTMPHKSVSVVNGHTQANEVYTGVPLADLLAKVETPVGKDLKGKAYLLYIVAEGTDHYRVLYSLDEADSSAHAGDVIVADTLNGAALVDSGAFELVGSEDKRPARWVRNLSALIVKTAD